jgi:hypothetical protein
MKKSPLLTATLLLLLYSALPSCKKSSTSPSALVTSLSFSVTGPLIHQNNIPVIEFPAVQAAVQEVDTLHTTVITGQYTDTSTLMGGISIHVIGDTTGTFTGSNVLATYTDASGNTYNSAGDSTDKVTITRFSKLDEGPVTGSFNLIVSGSAGTLTLINGQFTASFLN